MYRRLMAWSMVITGVACLAFLVPLAMNVRQYQRDIAMVRANQEAREVLSYAGIISPSRIQTTLRNLDYDESPNRIVVWYDDSVAVSARPNDSVGPAPDDVRGMLGGSVPLRTFQTATEDGQRVLWPASTDDGTVVVAVDVPTSELNRDVAPKLLWLVAVGTAIVLAVGVIAGRLGPHIVPPAAAADRNPQPVG